MGVGRNFKQHDIIVRYVVEARPNISSSRSPQEIARSIFYDYWSNRQVRPEDEPEFVDVTVDGEVFTSIEETYR